MAGSPVDSSFRFALCTPSDTAILTYHGAPVRAKGISFSGAGALAIKDDTNTTVIIPSGALAVGVIHHISTQQILATGTSATGIVVYY